MEWDIFLSGMYLDTVEAVDHKDALTNFARQRGYAGIADFASDRGAQTSNISAVPVSDDEYDEDPDFDDLDDDFRVVSNGDTDWY